ncbi:phage portal protein family protein [Azospirillum aestuarii]|uniref:phage portal protein family protein n=1 Tax=Azospirillum aestuarii TaxID=2802052 RepID=UPI004054CD29
MSDDQITKAAGSNAGSASGQSLLTEVGRGGLRHWSGYIYDDEDPQLRGLQAIRKYREMTKDPTIAAMLFALTALFRSVSWRIESSSDTPAHREARDFVEGVLFEDMEHTWEDFVADAVTMFPYGFAPFEMVYRKRTGTPKGADPLAGSQYKDGKIGLRKIALRSQDTVARWWFDQESDDLLGLYQLDPVRGREVPIPIERLVLIRTTPNRGNPEGKSILEPAVRPYTALRMFENAEASVAVRAGGIVTLEIPVGDYNDQTKRAVWEQLAKEMADDRAGFILLPTIIDKEGKKVDAYKVGYTVADGRRSGDFSPIIGRKKQEMASVALADFILLGHNNKGALNLSTDKTHLLREAVMSYLRGIAAPVNRVVIPRLWAVNGLPRDTMPKAVPGDLDKANLQVLGAFLTAMTGAGMVMDDALEDALRAAANLPLKPKELEGQGDEGGSAVSRPGKAVAPAQRPKKPVEAPADDDGLVDAAPDAPTGGKAPRSASARAAVSKAAPEDIAALAALGPDDPVYREALAVLAGGEIPDGVEKAEGGLPGAGQSPFDTGERVAKHNPYHDARGRFTFGPESGSGSGGGSLKDFLESEGSGIVVVARLPVDIQTHFGAKTTRVFLSSSTRDTHGHHNWTAEDFANLQEVLDRGEVRADREHHVIVAHLNDKWWYAALKVTKDQKEVYLQSFRRMRPADLPRFYQRGEMIRKPVGK